MANLVLYVFTLAIIIQYFQTEVTFSEPWRPNAKISRNGNPATPRHGLKSGAKDCLCPPKRISAFQADIRSVDVQAASKSTDEVLYSGGRREARGTSSS